MIELTNECQLACVTCPRDKKDAHDYDIGTMSFETFQQVFDGFGESVDTLDLTGLGESLTHPDIWRIIRWVRSRRDVHIYLTTNTILLTPRNIERLHADPVDTLCISIDGVTQEQFSAIRGPLQLGKLKRRVASAVGALRERMDFILCTVLMSENLGSMVDFVELAAELHMRKLSLKPLNLVAHDLPLAYYDQFRTPRFQELAEAARLRGSELGVEVSVFSIGEYDCIFPWEMPYVTWDGFLVPCCAKPFPKRLHFGNVLEVGYETASNSASAVEFRQALAAPVGCPEFCSGCHVMSKTMDASST
ncbi:radical SAM protein [Solirubrobacter soli]|uniref:radical SAM protein n=1 Tax=Solirubrobacter soli TaxID=363832 RepID=UPI000415A622|nr:radical SAM protein [Solirubrobacter soli]